MTNQLHMWFCMQPSAVWNLEYLDKSLHHKY